MTASISSVVLPLPRLTCLFACCCLFLVSCSQNIERLPVELELTDVRLEIEDLHTFGPAGINEAFFYYLIPHSVSQRIEQQGLSFFDSLNTPSGDPEWMGFDDWKTPPIEKNDQWLRKSYRIEPMEKLHLSEFYGDALMVNDPYLPRYEFSGRIPIDIRIKLSEALSDAGIGASANLYYSFGGYRGQSLLIIMPSYQAAYYLYRD